jgi:hypothetical protein
MSLPSSVKEANFVYSAIGILLKVGGYNICKVLTTVVKPK